MSDTKLTMNPNKSDEDLQQSGTIKSVILRDDLCLSFAGNIEYFSILMKLIKDDLTLSNIVKKALEVHHSSKNISSDEYMTDFMICSTKPFTKIYIFSNGIVTDNHDIAYIGCPIAEAKFKQVYRDNIEDNSIKHDGVLRVVDTPKTFSEYYTKMFNAMNFVINDSSIESVGGYVIPIVFEEGKFHYNNYLMSYISQKKINETVKQVMETKGSCQMISGSIVDGSHVINLFPLSVLACAIHMPLANIGVIYSLNEDEILYPYYCNLNHDEFFKMIKEHYDTKLNGVIKMT